MLLLRVAKTTIELRDLGITKRQLILEAQTRLDLGLRSNYKPENKYILRTKSNTIVEPVGEGVEAAAVAS